MYRGEIEREKKRNYVSRMNLQELIYDVLSAASLCGNILAKEKVLLLIQNVTCNGLRVFNNSNIFCCFFFSLFILVIVENWSSILQRLSLSLVRKTDFYVKLLYRNEMMATHFVLHFQTIIQKMQFIEIKVKWNVNQVKNELNVSHRVENQFYWNCKFYGILSNNSF